MKQSQLWLLALLSVLALTVTTSVAVASENGAHVSGSWELGMSGINTDDNAARVNEYGSVRADDGIALAPKLDLEFKNGGFLLEAKSETMGPRDQKHELGIDAGRVFKYEGELDVLEHHKDHDNLEHLGATMQGDIDGDQPRVFTNATKNPEQYAWELDQDYIVTRREWKNEAELIIPQLPNVTFKAGVRVETREGMEQAIALSKCSACHVEANPKEIDERTEEYTLGFTGKFGLLTVDYEYLTRDFEEDAGQPTYNYWSSGKVRTGSADVDNLNYAGEELEYNKTPDSEKDSHMIKARLDLPRNSSITASYVKADIDSSKEEDADVYTFVDSNTLSSEFESFALKGATRIGDLRLSIRGNTYEIDGPEYSVNFTNRVDNVDLDHDGVMDTVNNTLDNPQHYEAAESRDVTEFGLDGVYRLARYTTLRLGYEYEEIDRVEEEHLGSTETSTYKIAANTRFGRGINANISYEYQDIDEPFKGAHVGIAQGHPDATVVGDLAYLPTSIGTDANSDLSDGNTTAVYYWNTVYPARGLESTSEPDAVHEAKFSTTWTAAANMALTAYARVRLEENDAVKYEQNTYVPGLSFWYAPNSKMNLTMAYNFNKQETENQMCVGWYHG
jgi:hypothetical protein